MFYCYYKWADSDAIGHKTHVNAGKSMHGPLLVTRVQHVSACVSSPLFLSERCGWLLRALGSPWVAQRVWAIPKWVSNSVSRSIESLSVHARIHTHTHTPIEMSVNSVNFNEMSCCGLSRRLE